MNLSFLKLINEQFSKEDDVLPLVVIGTCSLHPVHTAIRKGVDLILMYLSMTCLRGSSCLLPAVLIMLMLNEKNSLNMLVSSS